MLRLDAAFHGCDDLEAPPPEDPGPLCGSRRHARGVNADLAAFAHAHPGVVVADWSGAIAAHTDLLAGDQIHPGQAGGRVYADAVAAGVAAAERERAYAQYERDMQAYRRLHHAELQVPQ
jgi:hypothetical protein